MARISLKEDAKLTKKGLLRPSVVAWLLGVAPKTIHAWKDIPVRKIHGVKYLRWHDILTRCVDAAEILDLPSDACDAYYKWCEKKPAVSITKPAVVVANNALEKAKALLKGSVVVTAFAETPKVVQLSVESQAMLTQGLQEAKEGKMSPVPAPVLEDDPEEALSVSEEYSHLFKDEAPVVVDGCLSCKHSITKFHTKYGCTFAKGTIAACHCKKGY